MSEILVGESWPRQTVVGVLPLTSAEQWSHPRPLTRCDGHKPGLSNELFCVELLTSHASPAPCTAHGTTSGYSAACVYTEHPLWKLEIMGNTLAQWHPFMCCLCPFSGFSILQNPLYHTLFSWCFFWETQLPAQVGAVFIFLPLSLQQLLR